MEQAPLTTVKDLVTVYLELHVSQLRQPAPVRCRIQKYFGPLLHFPLESLTIPIILGWTNGIRQHSRTQADSCLSILRSMFNCAIAWQMYKGINPGKFVTRKRPRHRTRYVLQQEIPALVRELERESVMVRLYFYLVLFVGCRPLEAELIKKQHIKVLDNGALWQKPDTKTGEPHIVPMPEQVAELARRHLAVIPPQQEYLFSHAGLKPLSKAFWHGQWKTIRKRANLEDVHIHDLRRTCSTYLLNRRTNPLDLMSLSKGVLNHSDLNTTRIYTQPMIENVQDALTANMDEVFRLLGKAGVRILRQPPKQLTDQTDTTTVEPAEVQP